MKLSKSEVRYRQRTQSGILKEEEVAYIKWLLLEGGSPREIAKDYCVSLWTIRAIKRGDTWSWVIPMDTPTRPLEPLSAEDSARAAESLARLQRLLGEATTERDKMQAPERDLDRLVEERAAGYGVKVDKGDSK